MDWFLYMTVFLSTIALVSSRQKEGNEEFAEGTNEMDVERMDDKAISLGGETVETDKEANVIEEEANEMNEMDNEANKTHLKRQSFIRAMHLHTLAKPMVVGVFTCQTGFEDIHPGEIKTVQPIQKIAQFEKPFREVPVTYVGIASAGTSKSGIAFKVGDQGATTTEIRLFARSMTPSYGAFIRISWIACGPISTTIQKDAMDFPAKQIWAIARGGEVKDTYNCQMGIENIRPGDLLTRHPIQKIVRFEEPFIDAPKTHVGVMSAGGTNSSIEFTVGDHGATTTEIRLFARSMTPSNETFIKISWIACGMMSETEKEVLSFWDQMKLAFLGPFSGIVADIFRCQIGFEDIHPGEIPTVEPILKTVQFKEPFTEAPNMHVGVASAGATKNSIWFNVTIGDQGATTTGFNLSAHSMTPSKGAYLRISWIACGMMPGPPPPTH